uniref:Transmembrane protein n=1 Tax=Cacopsylla melanoneura TaxID=428564 RepID=A0A8D8YX13_9HEMI
MRNQTRDTIIENDIIEKEIKGKIKNLNSLKTKKKKMLNRLRNLRRFLQLVIQQEVKIILRSSGGLIFIFSGKLNTYSLGISLPCTYTQITYTQIFLIFFINLLIPII